MEIELTHIVSIKSSAAFGLTVDGCVNRTCHVKWRPDNLLQFVEDTTVYPSNLILPNNYTTAELEAFREAVEKRISDGDLKVYGYEFPVSVVSEGKAIAYKNLLNPNSAPLFTIRRAWPHKNADREILTMIRLQVAKAIENGKIEPIY
ncbi:MAG: hypothetical protein IJV38_14060 [Prevotella sp.]|nr:hypothetical protein [Prevotella sp.]